MADGCCFIWIRHMTTECFFTIHNTQKITSRIIKRFAFDLPEIRKKMRFSADWCATIHKIVLYLLKMINYVKWKHIYYCELSTIRQCIDCTTSMWLTLRSRHSTEFSFNIVSVGVTALSMWQLAWHLLTEYILWVDARHQSIFEFFFFLFTEVFLTFRIDGRSNVI